MIRSIRYITLLVLLQFVTGISVLYAQSITSASGIVRDSVSGEPLSYVSVMFENSTIGAMTDDDGAFSLQNDKGLTRLVVSSLGYDNKVVNLKAGQKNNALNVLLRPTSFEIAEVVVKPKREKYSRKDNPAVELIKKVIEHKNDNRIEAKDEYQSEVYEKLSMSLDDFNPNLEKNKFLKKYGPITWRDTRAIHDVTQEYIDELKIKCTSSKQKARELSGGNQQKVCLAKAFALQPRFLFVSEPTRGIDVGAKALVLDALKKFNRENGVTVVMISSELEELRTTCDRIAIVSGGRIVGILPATESSETFGALMVSQVK